MSLEPITTLMVARHLEVLKQTEATQGKLLKRILCASQGSAAAKMLGISGDETSSEFLSIPPRPYSFYNPLVERVLDGDPFTFSRDPVVALGETSGSTGSPKLIPHTEASLHAISRFAKRLLLFQIHEGKHYFPRFTKWLAITASTNVRIEHGVRIGFISGLMHKIAREKRGGLMLPSPAVAAISDWDERIERTIAEAWDQRVGSLLGVPAYLIRFLESAAARAGTQPLGDVWPLLDRVYYSGTSLAPYRDRMEQILGRQLCMQGLYTATEGSFGAELDAGAPDELHLMVDLAVFTFRKADNSAGRLLAAGDVVRGEQYELFVTTLGGLIQYQMGDVVEVTETRPLRVRVVGRTEEEINIATEKLSLKQAYAALDRAPSGAGGRRDRFIVLPDPTNSRRHLWILEAAGVTDEEAAVLIDEGLSAVNPSYAALRDGDTMLERPRVLVCDPGCFDAYVESGFARRGQFKFRHLYPDAAALTEVPGLEAINRRIGGQ